MADRLPYDSIITKEPVGGVVPNPTNNLVATVQQLYEAGKKARSYYDKEWDKRWDYYKGKQNQGKPVMNIIRSTIQTMLPLLTDAKPGINVLPSEPSDYKFAKLLQKLVEYFWDKPQNSMQHTMLELVMDQSIYDAGIAKVFFDTDLNDIVIKSIQPKNIYINKEAIDFDKDCTYVIEKQYMPISWLKTRFPEKAMLITKDASKNDDTINPNDVTVVAPIDQRQPIGHDTTNNVGESDCRDTVEVWECWIDSEEEETLTNEDGTLTTKKKYPNCKLVTYLPNQKLVLQEVPNPYKHGKKPYVRFVDAVLPHSFWGEGEVGCLIPAQNNVNMVLTNMLSYFKLMGNPIWFNEDGSGVDSADITNDTALVLSVAEGKMGSIKRDIPPAMQAGMLELFNSMLRNSEIESGINDSSQGRRPVGITAASAIEALQEAAQTRIRLKERNMQTSLTKMGTMLVELMMQFYNVPRIVRITGEDGNEWPSFFEFYVDEKDGNYTLNKKEISYNEKVGDYVSGEYTQSGPFKGTFDIKIMSGTSQPQARAARSTLAMQLRQMKEISRKELLDALEWPKSATSEEDLKAEQETAQ